MSDGPLVVGIELGGTKCIASLGRGRHIVEQARFATTTPDETLSRLAGRIAEWRSAHPIESIGIASFGPLALDDASGRFSGISATPKAGWSGISLAGYFGAHLDLPLLIDTDVAGAALAEWRWGTFAGARSLVYLTIGTGIGGALLMDGRLGGGCGHAEMGHVRVRRRPGDQFAGTCSFHGDCLEGIASGPAIAARAGAPAADLGADHPVWLAVADEMAELVAILILTSAPAHILLGGGVGLSAAFPMERLRRSTLERLAGYVSRIGSGTVDRVIARASLGELAGPLGSIALAERALAESSGHPAVERASAA